MITPIIDLLSIVALTILATWMATEMLNLGWGPGRAISRIVWAVVITTLILWVGMQIPAP